MPYSTEGITISVRNNANVYNVLREFDFFIIVTQDKGLDFGKASH
jgi:hypothetical protein